MIVELVAKSKRKIVLSIRRQILRFARDDHHTVAFSFSNLTISRILINLNAKAANRLAASMIEKLTSQWKDNSFEMKLNPITNNIKSKRVKIKR